MAKKTAYDSPLCLHSTLNAVGANYVYVKQMISKYIFISILILTTTEEADVIKPILQVWRPRDREVK